MSISNGIYYSQTNELKISTSGINRVTISTAGTITFTGITSGSTLINVAGVSGNLLSINDSFSGNLLTVSDSNNLSIFHVNSNYSIIGGTPSNNTFVISGTNVGIGGILAPTNKLDVSGETNPVRFRNLSSSANTRFLTTNSDGVITFTTNVVTSASVTNVFVQSGSFNYETGVATFTNTTGGTFTVNGFVTPPESSYFSGKTTYSSSTANSITFSATCGNPSEYIANYRLSNGRIDLLKIYCYQLDNISSGYQAVGHFKIVSNNNRFTQNKTFVQCHLGFDSGFPIDEGYLIYYEWVSIAQIDFFVYSSKSQQLQDAGAYISIRITVYE